MRRLAVLVTLALAPLGASAADHAVTMDGFAFKPQTLRIKRGDTVTWSNKDIVDHTATSANPAFDSKAIHPGGRWTWTATQAGQYKYVCAFHPNMTAVIDVE